MSGKLQRLVRRDRISFHEGTTISAAISVDKEWVQAVTFPRRYAEQLVLLAFADGRDFKIHFEQISVNWSEQ
jgi:hypothetical protein